MRLHLLLIPIGLAAAMVLADETLDESQAIPKIELLGGKVTRDEMRPNRPVVAIDFRGSTKFRDKYLHLMKSFKDLKLLNLVGIEITNTGMEQIRGLRQMFPGLDVRYDDPRESKQIMEIEGFGGSVIRDDVSPGRPAIRVVLIEGFNRGQGLNDGQVHVLDAFTALADLQISKASISDNGLTTISKITTLQSLNLSAAGITDAGLKELVGLTQLTSLRLDSCEQITDTGLKEIGRIKGLRHLGLGRTQLTDAGLTELHELKNLTNLYLSGTALTGLGLKELSGFPNLATLDLADTKITDEGLKHLAGNKSLTALDLMFCKHVTDAGLRELREIKSLTSIRLLGSEVTDEGVAELQEAVPDLKIIR